MRIAVMPSSSARPQSPRRPSVLDGEHGLSWRHEWRRPLALVVDEALLDDREGEGVASRRSPFTADG